LVLLSWDELDALDFTKLGEQGMEVFLSVVLWETLNEEVALLLGVLESLLLTEDLCLSLIVRDSWLNVDLGSIEFLFVKVSHGVVSATGSV
jgi:hypothetical protein